MEVFNIAEAESSNTVNKVEASQRMVFCFHTLAPQLLWPIVKMKDHLRRYGREESPTRTTDTCSCQISQ